MRTLPGSLASKLLEALQTKGNNADPKMKGFIQQAYRYIHEGTTLNPIVPLVDGTLGPMDVAIRREDPNYPAHELTKIYINNGSAKVATSTSQIIQPIGDRWVEEGTIGPAVDVAIEFDGYWVRNKFDPMEYGAYGLFSHITVGEPYFFRVLADGSLVVRKGLSGTDSTLVADGVTKCCALRGWKSIRSGSDDQGLIVLYIRDGDVRYRTLAEQVGGSVIWESEQMVSSFDTSVHNAENIALFRTNDYRMGLLAEINGILHWTITQRNWAGMAIPDEIISASIRDLTIDFIEVEHITITKEEIIIASIQDLSTLFLWAGDTQAVTAQNVASATTVIAESTGTGDGIETVFSLLHEPVDETVYLDGVPVDPLDYVVDEKDIIFFDPPSVGEAVTVDYTWEDWGKKIKVVFDHGITNAAGQHTRFNLEDDAETGYEALATEAGDPVSPQVGHFSGSREVIVTFADFNNAYPAVGPVGEMHITYAEGSGYLQGEAGQDEVKSFNISFTPINLDPSNLEPPEVEVMWNE